MQEIDEVCNKILRLWATSTSVPADGVIDRRTLMSQPSSGALAIEDTSNYAADWRIERTGSPGAFTDAKLQHRGIFSLSPQ
jgi:hypothetical protein